MGVSVGIDFGTSNSGVAIFDGSRVQLLPVDSRSAMPEVTRTILYITRDFKHYIGQEAVELYYRHNVNRLRRFVKKWVGEIDFRGADMHYVRDVYTYVDELQPGRLLQFIKTALRSDGYEGTQIFDRYYTTAEIVTAYLSELKQRAEMLLDKPITSVTIGRPVKYSLNEEGDRRAQETMLLAAQEAGFERVTFELEPAAAALYYEMTLSRPENVLVFDFGGGTLDITIARLGDPHDRRVYASGGISVAGSDFDRAIIQQRMLAHFGKGRGSFAPEIAELINAVADWAALPDLSTPLARGNLERAILERQAPVQLKALEALIFNDLAFSFYNTVESAKIALSSQGATAINLKATNIDLWELYTRYQFEKDIQTYREQIEAVLLETLHTSGLSVDQIDAVVKTGGSSNIPVFTGMLNRIFGPERVKTSAVFNSVTAGLAIKAYEKN